MSDLFSYVANNTLLHPYPQIDFVIKNPLISTAPPLLQPTAFDNNQQFQLKSLNQFPYFDNPKQPLQPPLKPPSTAVLNLI